MQTYEQSANVELRVEAEPGDAAAKLFVERARERGRLMVALSGGKTPAAMFELLATKYSADVDWTKVHFFWSDERPVAPEHADSNFGLARTKLLDPLGVPAENIHRFEGERPPAEAAARYAKELRRAFGLRSTQFPRFDLLFLGLGEDGHTASLFPGSSALSVKTELAVANPIQKLMTTRLTLTYPVLNEAAFVAVLVSGKAKAAIVQEVLKNPANPERYPIQGVNLRAGRLLWILDQDAAAPSAV